MAGLLSADEVFEKAKDTAVGATNADEKALQIDYEALQLKFRAALGDRKVARCHINKFLPEGYEDQGRFNLLLLTAGNVIFDIVIGDSYFRYDVVSVGQLDKVQVIDAMWDNREKRREEPFLTGTLTSPASRPASSVLIAVCAITGCTASAKPAPRLVTRKLRRVNDCAGTRLSNSGSGVMSALLCCDYIRTMSYCSGE
jgi:hypothetical protein